MKANYPPIANPPNASVMLLLYTKEENTNILFIERSPKGNHAGEIGLPGGKLELGESLTECCLRETFEEVHLTPSLHDLKILGSLPPCITYTTTMYVQPYIGTFNRSTIDKLTFDTREVTRVIEIPLEQLLSIYQERGFMLLDRNTQIHQVFGPIYNISPSSTDIGTNKGTIWGMTSRILTYSLLEIQKYLQHKSFQI